MTASNKQRLLWAVLAACLTMFGMTLFTSGAAAVRDFAHLDFYDYWLAARALLVGQSPYDGAWADAMATTEGLPFVQGSNYIYAPWLAVVLRPLAMMDPSIAAGLWFALSAVTMMVIVVRTTADSQWAALPLLLFPPVLFSLFVGQINLLLLGAVVAGFALRERRPALAGVLFALAAATKVGPVLLLAVMAAHRRWRLLGAALGTLALLAVVGIVGAPGATTTWIDTVLPSTMAMAPHHGHPANQSVYALLIRMCAPNQWTTPWVHAPALVPWLARGVAVAMLALLALRIGRRASEGRQSEPVDAASAITAIVILSPLSWESSYALLLAPLLWLWRRTQLRPALVGAWLLVAAQRGLDDFANHPENHPLLSAAPPLSALALLGAVVVFAVCVREDRSGLAGADRLKTAPGDSDS